MVRNGRAAIPSGWKCIRNSPRRDALWSGQVGLAENLGGNQDAPAWRYRDAVIEIGVAQDLNVVSIELEVIVAKIPQDIYEQVREFALLITNAVVADDDVLRDTHYTAFHAYYRDQVRSGRCHPFILETLADYTDDESLALKYYEEALSASRQLKEPLHSILIAIGERHRNAKRFEVAEAYARDGRIEAERCGDWEMVREAESLLAKIKSGCSE